jgi:hypothetical protein
VAPQILCGISERFYARNVTISGQIPRPKPAKRLTFNTSFRLGNCFLTGRAIGGIALVTPMRGVRPGIDVYTWDSCLLRRYQAGLFTMGVAQLKISMEEAAGVVV